MPEADLAAIPCRLGIGVPLPEETKNRRTSRIHFRWASSATEEVEQDRARQEARAQRRQDGQGMWQHYRGRSQDRNVGDYIQL